MSAAPSVVLMARAASANVLKWVTVAVIQPPARSTDDGSNLHTPKAASQ